MAWLWNIGLSVLMLYTTDFPGNVLCRVWQPKWIRNTNRRQGTDWTSADLFCFPVCSTSQVLVRRLTWGVRKQGIGWLNFTSKQQKASGTNKTNLLHLARHRKRLMKRLGCAVDGALRRTGLWASTASPVSGPTTRALCSAVQNRGAHVLPVTHMPGCTNNLLFWLEAGFAEFIF